MQSIAVPVTLTLELHPQGADIGALECEVCVTLIEAGRRLWAGVVARLEASLPVPVGCAECGGYLSANGRAARRVVTLAGDVELRRRRYRCRECGAETVPLDDALGLEPRVSSRASVSDPSRCS